MPGIHRSITFGLNNIYPEESHNPGVESNYSPDPPAVSEITETDWESADPTDALQYDSDTETYRTLFNGETETVCHAIVVTLAVVTQTDPLDLPPLYSAVDPESLEGLVSPSDTGPPSNDVRISFTFNGYTVVVNNTGIITVQPRQEGDNGQQEF